ncbi:1-deoxy-D-xylulose-5-phosphate synthase [Magnetovirga frankeli]|uniref:1-deoxy-D-xylulose-5-phosphate synthase n=1 Tax=Magnetovirga frankeli TaxID=947516 RepID=UPI0012939203|nr:1-deoxy-D-xylulose-5-phosphate synthase [gamma proteobacterium SS-5]
MSNVASEGADYPLLSLLDSPADLRRLPPQRLQPLADELRRFLIQSVSRTGGHLAAGLGVVELTLALHYVFDTPEDRLVWDVGHQAYPHKIITGRREQMAGLRQSGGISGFPKRSESPYDTFGVGHSSTSISAALGMAIAARRQGLKRHSIAVIGDGALTGGMALEALNHAGSMRDLDLLVVLNDNDMSISKPVGAMSNYLAKVLSSRFYNSVRDGGKATIGKIPGMRDFMGRWEEHMKGMVMPGTFFEELGFNYIGPLDGHDLPSLLTTLGNMSEMQGPRLLHVVTQKGRGFHPAENDPCVYHGVTPFDPDTGEMNGGSGRPTYTQIFGQWLCDKAEQDPRLVAITPAMGEGSGMVAFRERFADRYFDVGIAEQHALTLAAGMACDGLKPVVAIYSTFLQRGYDQLIHDVALQNLDVTLAVDRGGLVGADGATHGGTFDLSFCRCIPNLLVMAPADEVECQRMLETAYRYPGPALVRYPRGTGPGAQPGTPPQPLEIGKGRIVRQGEGLAILSFGGLLGSALDVAERCNATVADMRFVKPLDEALLGELADGHATLISLEENAVQGGAGSAVNEWLAAQGRPVRLCNLGLPDRFIEHGSQDQQRADAGLDAEQLWARIKRWL